MSRWLWVGLFVLAVESVSFAQTPVEVEESTQTTRDENLDQAARLTFQAAREAFSAGNYELALDRFEQAYQLSPRPVLLYNIGVTLDRLRRDEDAVARFTEYLERVPDAPDRTEVEARIRVLQHAIDERRTQDAAREEQERLAREEAERRAQEEINRQNGGGGTPTQPEESSGLHPAIALGVGGAALVAGGLIVWSGLDASSRNDDYETYTQQPDAVRGEGKRLFDRVRSAETRTNALIGVASGLAATAVVLAIFSDWSFGGGEDAEQPSTTVVGGPTPGGFQLGLTQRF
ncbi:MAG: tetratricopeptide repeat protein [Sandaracinus sp.]|nr:tetratricopeptide repeat protein [Sandaracinus sp.]MCB9611487.1 tetratricopeptide repeat protein [Sandaracinus sp.]MCB9617699.1 tetratricopeptide repeat protein [Sandaracinus sp.]